MHPMALFVNEGLQVRHFPLFDGSAIAQLGIVVFLIFVRCLEVLLCHLLDLL